MKSTYLLAPDLTVKLQSPRICADTPDPGMQIKGKAPAFSTGSPGRRWRRLEIGVSAGRWRACRWLCPCPGQAGSGSVVHVVSPRQTISRNFHP